jgi:hypothetical protein
VERISALVLILAAAACQMQADHDNTQYLCGLDDSCPPGFHCQADRCVVALSVADGSPGAADAAASAPCDGDGTCEAGEDCANCWVDCPCGGGEGCQDGSCVALASCGDSSCQSGESCSVCPQDCGSCGPICGANGCEAGETCSSCAIDCGACCAPLQASCTTAPCCTGESCNSFSKCCLPASKTAALGCSGNADCCNSSIYGGDNVCNCGHCCKPVGTNCGSPDECCCGHTCVSNHCQ